MNQKQSTPAQPSVTSTDTLHGNAQAKVLADKANAALEHLISPAITPKLSELPTVEARLLALADAIERQELVKHGIGFNMAVYYTRSSNDISKQDKTGHHCGTVACLAGWTTLLEDGPNKTDFAGNELSLMSGIPGRATAILGIDYGTAVQLFMPSSGDGPQMFNTITPEHAVAVVRHLAATGHVRWSNFDNAGNPK